MALGRVMLCYKKAGLLTQHQIILQNNLLEFISVFRSVILDEKVDDTFPESQFDSNVLAEKDLTFKNILINKDHFDRGHQVLKFLIVGKCTQRIYRLRMSNKVMHQLFGKIALLRNLENHFPFDLSKVFISFGKLNKYIQLLFGNNVHLNFSLSSNL